MHTTPRFLQGIVPFTGLGLRKPFLPDPVLSYVVPDGVVAQPVYLRAGNSCAASSLRHKTTTAREPMCFSPQTTRSIPA